MRRLSSVSRGYPPRLLGFALTAIAVGAPVAVGAAILAGTSSISGRELGGVAVFFACTLLAELRPVPIDLDGERLISLAFVFVVASQLLFGWEWSVLIGASAIAVAQVPHRVGPIRTAFNASVYAVAAALASLPALIAHTSRHHEGYAELTLIVFVAGAIFVLTNVTLVCIAIALATGNGVREVVRDHLRHSGPPFAIMAFIAAQAVIFWNLSPALLILVGAPLFTLSMYQWQMVRSRAALKAAETDSLTGLKNHRAYEQDVEAELLEAEAEAGNLTLCLIDVDRFKQVNDRFGHPIGDTVLKVIGTLVERAAPGRGYRLGGDEFAILFSGPPAHAEALARTLQERLARAGIEGVPEPVTFSGGIAVFPDHAADSAALKKHADLALYQSKHSGKGRFSVYAPDQERRRPGRRFRNTQVRTAEKLVALLDSRDAYMSRHSIAVSQLAEGIGTVLGLDEESCEQLRIGGLLHDLGKIAIADSILSKPGPLSDDELAIIRTHPQIAFDLLDGHDLAPVDTWILHHHEHLDGSGYPYGLSGAAIPYGSRVILVADAFEAMTTHRSYRRAISVEAAMAELRDKAGTQFDPLVVSALESQLSTGLGVERPTVDQLLAAWSS